MFRGSIYSAIIYYSIDTFPVFEMCARRYCSGDRASEARDYRKYLRLIAMTTTAIRRPSLRVPSVTFRV